VRRLLWAAALVSAMVLGWALIEACWYRNCLAGLNQPGWIAARVTEIGCEVRTAVGAVGFAGPIGPGFAGGVAAGVVLLLALAALAGMWIARRLRG
jgi:hypothetical protein